MRKWALYVVLIAAVLGSVVAAISTSQHIRIAKQGLEEVSFCAISEKINCDVVNASSYSEVLGIPVAWFGFVFYLIVVGVSLIGIFSKKDRRAITIVVWGASILGFIYSVYLGYIATSVLGVWCVECLAMYVVNILLVVFLFISLGIPLAQTLTFLIDYLKTVFGRPSNLGFLPNLIQNVAVLLVIFLVGTLSVKAFTGQSRPLTAVSVDEKLKGFNMQSLYSIEPDPNWPVWGNPNAKVTIIEFSEFQCPFCRVAAVNVKPHLQEFRKDVRLYFANYPLDNSCNEEMDHPMHQYACLAAKVGVCANKQGKFWQYHDDLFRAQRGLNEEKIYQVAENLGMNHEELKACVEDPSTEAQIKKDLALGKKIYVDGTPSIYLDNRKLRYWQDSDFLQKLIKNEIKKEGGATKK